MKALRVAALMVAFLSGRAEVLAIESVRTQEIFECRDNEVMTWGDGLDRPAAASPMKIAYNPAGAPPWFSEKQASGMVALAAAAWSLCGAWPKGLRASQVQKSWLRRGRHPADGHLARNGPPVRLDGAFQTLRRCDVLLQQWERRGVF